MLRGIDANSKMGRKVLAADKGSTSLPVGGPLLSPSTERGAIRTGGIMTAQKQFLSYFSFFFFFSSISISLFSCFLYFLFFFGVDRL
jgi:hypothetical protein